jgi:beta-phosphoglucomutase
VFEDSAAGVKAGKTGGFYVVGIGDTLVTEADMIVPSLEGMTVERLRTHFSAVKS